MDIQFLRDHNLIIYECISGSKAYGLALPHSDTDIKGVFVLPKELFYGLDYVSQVANETNDIVFYELKKFIDLLCKNNPSALELLGTPEESILFKSTLLNSLYPELFLSKLCKNSFAGYAMEQIRKARGLNKKIVNPVDKERKSVLDFCFVPFGQGALPVKIWLDQMGYVQDYCGLVKIPNMADMYHLFYDKNASSIYKGIVQKDSSNDISLSAIAKNVNPECTMLFNKSGYSKYCMDYKSYWDWVENRNTERYETNLSHGNNFDSKNMMHTFRLLEMSEEIATEKKIFVRRPNRDYLLKIRSGVFNYEELLTMVEEKIQNINLSFDLMDKIEAKKLINH